MAVTSDDTSPVALHLFPATAFYTLYLPFTSAIAMVVVDSTTRRSPTERDVVQIPTASAHNICDGLFRMVNCFIPELPEAELRDVRNILETLLTKVDWLLDHTECDLSLNFDNLAVNAGVRHYPDGEDFGASTVSTSITIADTGRSALPSPPRRRRETTRIPVTPAPTPAPIPDPTPILIPTHGQFPLVLSSRENVGFPDYTHHPLFIRPGIPGPYQHSPTSRLSTHTGPYHVVFKGLYVGIFTDWEEVSPWVTGVSGSLYRKAKTWEEARDVYNARLTAGVIQILS